MGHCRLRRGTPIALPVRNYREISMNELFRQFAQKTSTVVGSPWVFIGAVLVIIIWALCGPMANYSDTWQLIINTSTTIITFLMVFLIQNTQNRDARALHIKLDELLMAGKKARTSLVDLENCSEEELERLEKEFHAVRKRARAREELAMRNGNAAHVMVEDPARRGEEGE
jgi:low affinity Fe/Cu permease